MLLLDLPINYEDFVIDLMISLTGSGSLVGLFAKVRHTGVALVAWVG